MSLLESVIQHEEEIKESHIEADECLLKAKREIILNVLKEIQKNPPDFLKQGSEKEELENIIAQLEESKN